METFLDKMTIEVLAKLLMYYVAFFVPGELIYLFYLIYKGRITSKAIKLWCILTPLVPIAFYVVVLIITFRRS